jgi:hypothetical protein
MVEHLPSMLEVLGSIPGRKKIKKKTTCIIV